MHMQKQFTVCTNMQHQPLKSKDMRTHQVAAHPNIASCTARQLRQRRLASFDLTHNLRNITEALVTTR